MQLDLCAVFLPSGERRVRSTHGTYTPLFTLTFSDDRLFPRSIRLVTKGTFEDVPNVTEDAVQIVDIDPVGSKTSVFSNDFHATLQYQWRWFEQWSTSNLLTSGETEPNTQHP